uniref:Voltage-gated hydrogen channel 1 n=1 Tax=Oryzias sinensis TaxID=183150 RepID=A0A8C7ZSK3_9TELE
MSRYLKHFSTVGDKHHKVWEDEELHAVSEDLSPASGLFPTSLTFREALKRLYVSERFQVAVVVLVILDACFVLAELLIDLSVIKLDHGHIAPEVFHYLSLAVLTFFMMELAGKLFAFRLEFFHHKFEMFDGLVVVVSFILDIVFIFHEDAFDGMGLLILLRLWRVARIINDSGEPQTEGDPEGKPDRLLAPGGPQLWIQSPLPVHYVASSGWLLYPGRAAADGSISNTRTRTTAKFGFYRTPPS